MKKLFFPLLVGLVSLFGEAQANLIVNGSFEQGNYTGGWWGSVWTDIEPGSTNLTGWANTGQGIINWHDNQAMVNPFDGTKVVDLNNSGNGLGDTGVLSQSFATSIGENYQLKFYLAGPGTFFSDPRQVQVNIAGIQHVFSQAASPNTALVWGEKNLTFTATAATTTLAFSSVDGSGYWGPLLDMVSVDAAVPEPSTLANLACGAALMLVFGRRRSKPAV